MQVNSSSIDFIVLRGPAAFAMVAPQKGDNYAQNINRFDVGWFAIVGHGE